MEKFTFRIIYKIDSDTPGDSGLRRRVVTIEDENEEYAEEEAMFMHCDQDFYSIELIKQPAQ